MECAITLDIKLYKTPAAWVLFISSTKQFSVPSILFSNKHHELALTLVLFAYPFKNCINIMQ